MHITASKDRLSVLKKLVMATVIGMAVWLSGILRSVKLLYYQLLMSTYRRSNILRSETSGAPDF